MENYLGEKEVNIKETKYKNFTVIDWAKLWIEMRSQYDGSRYKMICLDEVQRILHGTKIKIKIASWKNGSSEERFYLGEPSKEYLKFVEEYQEDGEYEWNNGIN